MAKYFFKTSYKNFLIHLQLYRIEPKQAKIIKINY